MDFELLAVSDKVFYSLTASRDLEKCKELKYFQEIEQSILKVAECFNIQ